MIKTVIKLCAPVAIILTLVHVGFLGGNPAGMPDRVYFKTAAETFTAEYYFALLEGKIYYKPNSEVTGKDEAWRPFPPDGLPGRKGLLGFDSPNKVVAISADGDNIIAVGDDGTVYYAKLHDFIWTDRWGMIPKGKLSLPPGTKALAMSHRGRKGAVYYEDIFGAKHFMGAGVTTLYILSGNGGDVWYADPWLPPVFDSRLCMPLRGRFVAVNMSASASTVFVIDGAGRMCTRLYDYDTAGENPVLQYTYENAPPGTPDSQKKRGLPAEGWREQPRIKGKITGVITILQNGAGNASRELRVEGVDDKGNAGYYRKPLLKGNWVFVATGHALKGKFLESGASPHLAAKITRDYEGEMSRTGWSGKIPVKLVDFAFQCEGGTIRFVAGGVTFDIPLYLRRVRIDKKGNARAEGMLVMPDTLASSPHTDAKRLRDIFFNRKKFVPCMLKGIGPVVRIRYSGGEMVFVRRENEAGYKGKGYCH